jgi:AAA domain-containing protein
MRWLWSNWLARGKFQLLAGAPGTGKTTIALAFSAMVTRGGQWPDGAEIDPGRVLIWSGEDDIPDTLLPRLLAAGGTPDRVHFIRGTTEHGKSRLFDPATDMPKLVAAARELPNLKLLIVDPAQSGKGRRQKIQHLPAPGSRGWGSSHPPRHWEPPFLGHRRGSPNKRWLRQSCPQAEPRELSLVNREEGESLALYAMKLTDS